MRMSTGSDSKVTPLRKKLPCPICGQPSARPSFPFCSQRCKDIDLNSWLSDRYAIPVTEAEENADDEAGE